MNTIIFSTDFTRQITVYKIKGLARSENIKYKPELTLSRKITLEDAISLIDESDITDVVFVGKHKLFKQLESYYKGTDKEIKISWQ